MIACSMLRACLGSLTVVVTAVAACTSFSSGADDAGPPTVDAATDTNPPNDAGTNDGTTGELDATVIVEDASDSSTVLPRCVPNAPFETPVAVEGPPIGFDGFRLTEDEAFGYYFHSNTLFIAPRINERKFGIAQTVTTGLPSPLISKPTHAYLTRDRRILFFESNLHIYVSTVDPNGSYGVPKELTGLLGHPWYDEERNLLYAARYVSGFRRAIWKATLTDAGTTLGQDIDVGASTSSNHSPVVSADGQTLFFASDRVGGTVAEQVFSKSLAASAPPATIVPTINAVDNDTPLWLSADGCILYMSSMRQGAGGTELFIATRAKQ